MPFLGLWGKKRGGKALGSTKSKPDITLVTDLGIRDASGPPLTAPPSWPLRQRPTVEQRPLNAIPESPEPLSVGYTPRTHPSPLASAPNTAYSFQTLEPRQTPSPSSSSPPRLPSSTPGEYQLQRSPPPRVRLPKIPPPGSGDWTPSLRHSRNAFSSSQEFRHVAEMSLPLTPPTSVSSFGSSKAPRQTIGSSPNWVSYPVPSEQSVHPAFRRSKHVTEMPPSPVSLANSPEIVSTSRKNRRSGRLLALAEPLYSFKQDWETSLQMYAVKETTTPDRDPRRNRSVRSPSQPSEARRTGKSSRLPVSPPSNQAATTHGGELSKFWHAQTAGTGGSRLAALTAKRNDEERQQELSRLDEQIRSVTIRLNALESISKRVQTLQVESRDTISTRTSARSKAKNDSCAGPKPGHHAQADSTGWETIDDATSELMSLQEKRRTIMLDSSSGSGSSFLSSLPSTSTETTSTRNHSRCDTLDSGFQYPARSATRRRRRGASTTMSRDESAAETGLATTVSCVRQAPAVVHMRTTTPAKTTRSRRHSRVGAHRAQQASAYSFITFRSVAKASLTPLERLDESYEAHDCIVEEDEGNSDWEDDEDEAGGVTDYSGSSNFHPSTAERRLSIFPTPRHTPSASLASSRTDSSRMALSRQSSRSSARRYRPHHHHHRYNSSSMGFDSGPQTPCTGVSRRAVAHHSRTPSKLFAVRISPMHVRSHSRVLDGSVRAAGNAKIAAYDVKRWFGRVPQRMTFGRRGASAARRRSLFFDAGIES